MSGIMEGGGRLERDTVQRVPKIVIGSLAHDVGNMRLAEERAKLFVETSNQTMVSEATPWADM
jgi:hypothetical protein